MVEIDKTLSKDVTATATIIVKWILAETVPTAPTGYSRKVNLDIDLGVLGTLWAFVQD